MVTAVRPKNLDEISQALGYAPQFIFDNVKNADRYYHRVDIPKANGGIRTLYVPSVQLRGLQRTINEKVLSIEDVHDHVYSYVKGRSPLQAARRLCGSKNVLRMDIHEFFPTINAKRVYGVFRKLGFNSGTSFILTKLCTCHGRLTQGSPTSPMLSNLVLREFDKQAQRSPMLGT